MRKILIVLLALACTAAYGQNGYRKFAWKKETAIHTIPEKYRESAAVYVTDDRVVEFAFDKEEFYLYRTIHRIIHINNDRGIESFNKIYLPYGEGSTMMDVKARTILPNGQVINLDKSNIKDIRDEDGDFKIFALDGLTPGCEVEYYFTVRKEASFFGREVISSRIPVMRSRVELISPAHLVFDALSFNGLPSVRDTVYGEKRYLYMDAENIDAMEEEKYAMSQANQKRVEFKLSYNASRNSRERMFTWNDLAKRIHQNVNETDDKENKKLRELLNAMDLKTARTDEEKIRRIENYLKKHVITRDDIPGSDAADLPKVIKNKIASERATMRLYLAMFRLAGIDYQVVLTGDREAYGLEPSFENWNNARHYLVYFPTTGKYLAPTEAEYRYPWIPPTWAATNGLFCVSTTIGNFTTSIGEIRMIPFEDYDHNFLNMEIAVRLVSDEEAVIDVKQLYGGYAAPNYRIPFVYLPADEHDKVLKQMVKFGANTENLLSHSFENREMEQPDPYKPFVINASVRTNSLVEHAGNKIIIRVGDLIGEQAQMYETKERQNLVDLHYPHALVRTIRLTIPEGYRVLNTRDLEISVVHREKDVVTMGFVSGWKQEGNVLIITIVEDYRNVRYPLEQYEIFKKVINAAADFNKVALILEK